MKEDKVKVIRDILEEKNISSEDVNEVVSALDKVRQEKEEAEREFARTYDRIQAEVEASRLNALNTILQVALKVGEEREKEYNRPVNRLKRFFDIF